MVVDVREATDDDLAWIERAIRRCAHAMIEFGGFYGACTTKLAPLLGPDRTMLLIHDDGVRLGFVDEDRSDGGYVDLSFFVVAHARRQGVSTAALRIVSARNPDAVLKVCVRPGNQASLATARAAGFVATGTDEWGDLVLVRHSATSG